MFMLVPASAQGTVDVVLAYGLEEIESPGQDPWKAEKWEKKYALDDLPVDVRIDKGMLVLAQRTTAKPAFPPEYETPSIRYVSTSADGGYARQLHAVFRDGRPQLLVAMNVMAIVPRASDLVLFSAHMHMENTGEIFRVASADASPRASLVTLLSEGPRVVLERAGRSSGDRSHLYIVTDSSLMSIFMGRRGDVLKTHYRSPAFAGRFPSSAVFDKDHLVIGSATGVAVAKMQQDIVVSVRYFATKGRSVQLRPAPTK